ncbi:hypothetical protein GOPIP_077_00410 [Gordonia polyisoprenivorans NBRC 16320 = JCM 10675]|uniref:7-carboxy-7-deazaguanine synthase n=1 Tax=Gordonia polyisoprenivorans TaxID=84595 RepID=A0A846WLZ6_9ACTN|nr:7-carboxy-7-deazaguanine synthase [Gordonia polyisoprenivorans]NKY01820.1 7-carboxy-7-deazaguanine synthase [Gordonia polyisoprenivorans]GAB25115.1 hypothetical protein GOPIP_077_00410 [Gordonia polyisoprenivorans NBRC 16320 = JCM 10675]
MPYQVKEIFYTLQGEGQNTGRPAVFCRFSGCNLWNGREHGRKDAICRFCDTDFVGTNGDGGGVFASADILVDAVAATWQGASHPRAARFVVCTGGEPLLQLDAPLVEGLHAAGFEVAVETNGTRSTVPGLDWVCVSPKGGTDLAITSGNELKLVFPQDGVDPARFESLGFDRLWLQPMDGPDVEQNTALAVRYCLENPQWRLSIQTHKHIGIR